MYSTLDDIRRLIPNAIIIQLTDDENTLTVNQVRVNEAIAQADSVINSYCATRHTVPFTAPVPAIIKAMSVDIAVYNLYSRRVEEIPETRSERYKNAIRLLEGIAKGTITLGVAPAPVALREGGVKTNKTKKDRTFTKDKMRGL